MNIPLWQALRPIRLREARLTVGGNNFSRNGPLRSRPKSASTAAPAPKSDSELSGRDPREIRFRIDAGAAPAFTPPVGVPSIYDYIFAAFAFFLGASIGSFLNVCIYRMPLGYVRERAQAILLPKLQIPDPALSQYPARHMARAPGAMRKLQGPHFLPLLRRGTPHRPAFPRHLVEAVDVGTPRMARPAVGSRAALLDHGLAASWSPRSSISSGS